MTLIPPKVALITGAARRIGASIAESLHDAGFQVAIHYHKSLQEAHDLAYRLNQKRPESARIITQDLCAEYAAENIMEATLAFGNRLDVLVNNASVFFKTPSHEKVDSNWDIQFNTNVRAPFLLSHAAFSELAKTNGSIVNIIDIHGEKALKEYSVYCQTKAALVMQTKSLAVEFAPSVRVNAVSPGAIAWPENENTLDMEVQNRIIAKTPLQRHGAPEYIGQAVCALVENPFVTGQIWAIDGGRSLR